MLKSKIYIFIGFFVWFVLGATTSSVQGLFRALCSRTIPGGAEGTLCDAGDCTWVCCAGQTLYLLY